LGPALGFFFIFFLNDEKYFWSLISESTAIPTPKP
jgi:hypothetical protein